MSQTLRFDVFTLFPEVFESYIHSSIIHRASKRKYISIFLHNIRDYTTDRHHVTDDEPYGGGGGMVMKPEPIFSAVESVLGFQPEFPVVLLTPQGRLFTQGVAEEMYTNLIEEAFSIPEHIQQPRIALICGRYEGVDERVRQNLVNDEISIGDYVLTGGELAALVVIDAITRIIPGVLGDPGGAQDDSFASGLLEYPHYTRPVVFREMSVPEVLLSGDHARIARWRREQALKRTWYRRRNLLKTADLSEKDYEFLAKLDANYERKE